MSDKKLYKHKDRDQIYYQLYRLSPEGFVLCQVSGSLSSIIAYESVEEAVKDGWVKFDEIKEREE